MERLVLEGKIVQDGACRPAICPVVSGFACAAHDGVLMLLPPRAPQDNSLLTMPPWINPWLLAAEAVSFGSHFLILYVPVLANIFGIVPLTFQEWLLVIVFASPVILIDEVRAFRRSYRSVWLYLRRSSCVAVFVVFVQA